MQEKRWLGLLLVLAQFGLIFGIVWYAGITGGFWSWVCVVGAILLGGWAVLTMHFNVSILPEVRAKQQLFTGGPYKRIRHPMYTSVLLLTFAGILHNPDIITTTMWLALLAVLVTKLRYEESLLAHRFKGYSEYMQRTKRLVPFIW